MNLIDFNLNFVKEEEYLKSYIDYLFHQSGKSLQYNLKAMDLPNSSYHYCRKNGFKNSYFTLEVIEKYFSVSFHIDDDLLKVLKDLYSKAFTECFFVDNKVNLVAEELKQYEKNCINTILEPIYYLVYVSVLDLPGSTETYKDIIPHKIVPMMEDMYNSFPDIIKYVYLDMLSQYYQATDEINKYPPIMEELERLDPLVDERVKTIAHYDMITMNFDLRNIEGAYKYTKSCEQLYIKYFNSKRLNYIQKNLTALAFRCGRYDEVVVSARNNLLFTSRDETKPVFYKQMIIILVIALIMTKKYDEAIESVDLIYQNEFTDYYNHAMLLKMYSYLKMKKNNELESIYKEIKKVEDERAITLSELIYDLYDNKKKKMNTFGKRLKPIYQDTWSGYRQICELLKLDYTNYLKMNNKYIDVLDM